MTRFKHTLKADRVIQVSWFARYRCGLNCIWNKDPGEVLSQNFSKIQIWCPRGWGQLSAWAVSPGVQGGGRGCCFGISCLCAPVATRHQWFCSWQPSDTNLSYCSASSLSACPRRQFAVCSLFSVVVFAIQPCILFWRWWGLLCILVKRELYCSDQKSKNQSFPHCWIDTVTSLQFLLRSCSLARSRSFR